MKIAVETVIEAPVADVWAAYTTPEDIKQWNAASNDWHTTQSTVDLRVGGVRVTFDAETTHPEEQQRQGWQAILNNFAKHVVGKNKGAK